MEVNVKQVDEINFTLEGYVETSRIDQKFKELKSKIEELNEDNKPSDTDLEKEAASLVFKEFLDEGIKKQNIDISELLGQPSLKKYEKKGDKVFFEVDMATSPDIDTNITYDDIIPSYTKPKASDEAIEKKLYEFALKQAPLKKIDTPREVRDGDVAVIDFVGYIDGKEFEGGKAENFKLKIGSNTFIPGFEEQIVGMEYNEEKMIKVTFPKNYMAKDLAGKNAEFKIILKEIMEQDEPKIDDEFAKNVLGKPDATLNQLKDKISDQVIAEELSLLYETELKPKLIDGLLKKFDFPLPNNIVEEEIDVRVRHKIKNMDEKTQKIYLENKEKFFELRESFREVAKDTIKKALIVEALAKKEGIEVDEQEVISALTYQAMMSGQDANELVKYYKDNNLMKAAQLGLTEDKLFGQLLGFHK